MKTLLFYLFVMALYGGIIYGLHHEQFEVFYYAIAQTAEQTANSLDMFQLITCLLLGVFAILCIIAWNIEERG